MTRQVKDEPQDGLFDAQLPATSSMLPVGGSADTPTAGSVPMDVDSGEEDGGQREGDIVVREIDVFLSPELSNQLHLMQFPLQRQASPQESSSESSDKPVAARIKPRHNMIELDYTTNTEAHQDYHGQYFLSKRTFSSQTIPVSTHMALGKMVVDGSAGAGLHLVPLARITQMRPNFHHVNEATMHLSSSADEGDVLQASLDGSPRRPLTFQKKESERAAMARKSSYSYKKASEEAEIWLPLEVHAEKSLDSEAVMAKVGCRNPNDNLLVGAPNIRPNETNSSTLEPIPSEQHSMTPSSAATTSLSSYVQSLNYLPKSLAGSKVESAIDETGPAPDVVTTAVTKMVQLMHQGWPMPYSILRIQFDPRIYSDEILLQALYSCAFLVRGNFVLQSRLLPIPPAVAQARTFLLFLFQSVGVIHRLRLEHVYKGDDEVTSEILLMLLEQVGTRAAAGWNCKVDDDNSFDEKFPGAASIHLDFWKKQVRRFSGLVERYQEGLQQNGGAL